MMLNVRLRVKIFENVHSQKCYGTPPGSALVWSTGDRLQGQVFVTAPPDSQLGRVAVSFLGMLHQRSKSSFPAKRLTFDKVILEYGLLYQARKGYHTSRGQHIRQGVIESKIRVISDRHI